jgi:hypothetical protein
VFLNSVDRLINSILGFVDWIKPFRMDETKAFCRICETALRAHKVIKMLCIVQLVSSSTIRQQVSIIK